MTPGTKPARALSAGVGDKNDQARRRNLSTVMTMLHHDGAMSRAELTKRTRLNRSTVGALAAELVSLGLATEEAATERTNVGRPSPIVTPNSNVVALAINPDLDAVVIGLVGLGGVVHKRVRYETDGIPTVRETVNIVKAVVDGMRSELESVFTVVGAGVAVPGLVKRSDNTVTRAPHLEWSEEPIAAEISAALGFPAVAGNDATLGVVAEKLFGAGRGVNDLVYLNGSTSGIGGGAIVGGRPLYGARGYAGEFGHTLVASDGLTCECGKIGCLETEVNVPRLLAVLGRDTIDLEELDVILLETEDSVLLEEISRQVNVLASAVASLISVFNPAAVVLGGFLGSLFEKMPERLDKRVKASSFSELASGVVIERGKLRSRLAIVGAAELAFAPLLTDPAKVAGPPDS